MKKWPIFFFLILVLLLFGGSFYYTQGFKSDLLVLSESNFQNISLTSIHRVNQHNLFKPLKKEAVPLPKLEARAVLSIVLRPKEQDLKSRILFEKEGQRKLPIASLTKLMTATVVLENYSLEEFIKISQGTVSTFSETGNLKPGEKLSVENLLYIMLIESSNDAAKALSEKIGTENFVYLMNKKAQELGLKNTSFINPIGLDSEVFNWGQDYFSQINSSSAEDLAKLISYISQEHSLIPEILSLPEFELYTPEGKFHHKLFNTNILLKDSQVLWGKTGYTEKSGDCIILVLRSPESLILSEDYLIVNIILGANNRFLQMEKLINWLNSAFVW
ncbi:MAG: hypothetical protein COZ88_01480 [Candidatus Nealsonbacteria bacterium CG_4_8_14_3_um_filter_34_13]|nr:MAG: hypothetical protein COZ88_01480 [Candidatus Nealsonbacteria bacterium CG_4_8_14_3_um_filter_34_13]